MIDLQILIVTAVIGVILVIGFFAAKAQQPAKNPTIQDDEEVTGKDTKKKSTDSQATGKKKRPSLPTKGKDTFTHPWLVTTLKGHSAHVLDLAFSENSKYLATCAEDRTVLLWTVKDFPSKEHKIIRTNVEYDHASLIEWSPDSKAFVVLKATANLPEVYKLGKKDDGTVGNIQPVVTFNEHHTTDVIGLGFSPTGKYVMTCSDKTNLAVWSIKGDLLATADTYHMTTYCARISPCGRFVATSGFTPDVKVWEVKFRRTGEFEKIHRAFELKGHSSGVFHFDFKADTSRMATISKDGSWKVFDTAIEFERGQEAQTLTTGVYKDADLDTRIALSPDASTVLIGQQNRISFFDAATADKIGEVGDVFNAGIVSLAFEKDDRWFVAAGDKYVRVFRNIPGLKLKTEDLKKRLVGATAGGMIERLKQQIEETEEVLKKSGESF